MLSVLKHLQDVVTQLLEHPLLFLDTVSPSSISSDRVSQPILSESLNDLLSDSRHSNKSNLETF